MTTPLRAVIVDDSSIYRSILTRVLKQMPDVELVGTAVNGVEALEIVEQMRPDLVLLDVEMPEMDGLEALEIIASRFPEVSVLMVSGVSDAQRTLKALSHGAIDFIVKPEDNGADALRKQLWKGVRVVKAQRSRTERLKNEKESEKSNRSPAASLHQVAGSARDSDRSRLVVIGISTGGPRALETLLPGFSKDLSCPILIVQHMPPGFTESLAQSLNAMSSLEVAEAKSGELLTPGRVLIAPGGRHMELAPVSAGDGSLLISLHDGAPRNECKPSVDVLLDSVRAHFHGNILAGIMTGMGSDGCQGVAKLKARGAYCIAQSEASCVVYGMPRAVCEAGHADETVPLRKFARRIEEWTLGIGPEGRS